MVAFANVKFLLVAVFLMMKLVNAGLRVDSMIFEAREYTAECTGSLVVTTNGNGLTMRFPESNRRTRLSVSSLRVEGCGCFYLYRRSNFRSSSMFVTHASQSISGTLFPSRSGALRRFPARPW